MDQRKQREIASKGGQAAHQKGTAHEFNSEEARAAGRKGGEAVSANRAHMSAIGRKGGESSHNSARNIGTHSGQNGGVANGHSNGDTRNDQSQSNDAIATSSDGENGAMNNQNGDHRDESNQYGHRDD